MFFRHFRNGLRSESVLSGKAIYEDAGKHRHDHKKHKQGCPAGEIDEFGSTRKDCFQRQADGKKKRHQFQHEVVANPGRFGISQKVANEWAFGLENYTTNDSTEYDPWGYCYNPVEMDARYFGEAVVREMTKDMINDLGVDYTKERTFEENSQPQFFINDRDWHIKAANEALGRGDMSGYKDHIDSARRSTK